ncbi:MAG: ABC transporter ATP-binding protein [Steroidobacteraceae bacterium]|nr:ABC transporter ATP-binding protein [Nevskiaceae bacterium]MCP5339332.1 ABC transporter ATP-binding protein [Nevskiaceae bacterium]MCP5471387.1 ABC transporter ATP-binding protein [Nevskiaceae bacterium]
MDPTARVVLRIENLVKRYRPERPPVLDGPSLTLHEGEYVAIMGESGVGKSTLLNLLAGLDRADAGRIEFDGVELGSLDDDAATLLRRRQMGFVFQAFHVLSYLTVAQNVALPLQLLDVAADQRETRVAAMLAAVGLGGQGDRHPRELSGGELQRVAIARALVHRPRLLLADEPTGNLDPRTAAVVLDLLRTQARNQAGAGILITHSLAAAETADRILVLDGHRLEPLAPVRDNSPRAPMPGAAR